jgi:PQQ-dependent catabolism-associated CXXCW motif protein
MPQSSCIVSSLISREAKMRFSWILIVALLAGLNGAALAETPEPQDYWIGAMHGDTPATIARGRVVHTAELVSLLKGGGVALVDVAEPPNRPANLAADAIWTPIPHRNIAGSVWIPGAGAGQLPDSLNNFFIARLANLTADDPGHPIVFYCHPKCWGSWNAAKRAINFGYRNVYWYPDGIEGWQDAGQPLAASRPEGVEKMGER